MLAATALYALALLWTTAVWWKLFRRYKREHPPGEDVSTPEDRAARLGLESAAGVRMAGMRIRVPELRQAWGQLGLGVYVR